MKRKEESSRSLAKETPVLKAKTSNKNLPMNPMARDSSDNLMHITPIEIQVDNASDSVNSRIILNTLSCKPCSKLF